jgi:hypothetical protein
MSVYVDELFYCQSKDPVAFRVGARNGHYWCHLWADSLGELFDLANRIYLKRSWFQNKPNFPHFDLTPERRRDAIFAGAKPHSLSEFLRTRGKRGTSEPGLMVKQRNIKMATKTTKAQLQSGTVFMDATAFNNLGGEVYAGLNIVKLNPGQAAGPFKITEILFNQDLGSTGKKKKKPVDVYCATDATGTAVRLPVAASLTQKLKDAKVGVGDSIAIMRGDDYTSKVYGTKGASYELRVVARAENKAKKSA